MNDLIRFDPVYTGGGNYGWALTELKAMGRVKRINWPKKVFLFMVPGSRFKVNRPPLLGMYPEGTEINYHPHIDKVCENGVVVPYTPSMEDQLSEDWIRY